MMTFGSLISRLWLILLVGLTPTVVLVAYNGWAEYKAAHQDIKQDALFYVRKLAENQQRHILETELFLKNLAAFDVLQNPASDACGKQLKSLLSLNPIYVNLGVPLASGDLLCNGFELNRTVNVSDRPYFRTTIDRGIFSVGSYQLDRAAQLPSINMAYPVRSQQSGEIIAAAVAVVSLSWWSQQLTDFGIHPDSLALVVDHNNQVLAAHSSGRPDTGVKLADIGLQSLVALKGQTGVIEISPSDCIKRLFAYTPLHDHGGETVMVLVGLPSHRVLQTLKEHLLHDVEAVVIAILLLAVLAGWAAQRALVKPIRSLLSSTDLLAGDMNLQLPKYQGSELSTLAERFQYIVEQRLKVHQKLKSSQSELRLACIRLESLLAEAPLGVIEWDAEARVSRWSGSSRSIFSIEESDVLGLVVE
ncbi:MAG: hypothetical protein OQK12_08190, partial [Motiliproteus sp.]|nr:hypothetical protein [Motiliproteus sp.]